MRNGSLLKPRRNKGIPIELISPDIKGYVTMELNQVGLVINSQPNSYGGRLVRILVGGKIGDGYRDDFVELSEPYED